MRKLLLAATALTLVLGSCKSKDDGGGAPANSWKLNGTSYSVATVTSIGGIINATSSSPVGSFSASFASSLPTANGTYRIVSGTSSSTTGVAITATTGAVGYISTGNDLKDATVTVNGGKVTIVVPEIWVKNVSGGTDSVKLSGSITQP